LDKVPAGAIRRSVTAAPGHAAGRDSLQVSLTDEVARNGRLGVDFGDQPTFVIIPADFITGVIEVDILSRLTPEAPDFARAFAGLAYHLTDGGDRFESVYLRPTNGRKVNPPEPRDRRAIQYFSYPGWPFDRLRDVHPDGRYEAGADIAPDEWMHLRLEIEPTRAIASVNGHPTLVINEPKAAAAAGAVGLFVDIGTEAFFADLAISPTG
jgi:hypothetical protein